MFHPAILTNDTVSMVGHAEIKHVWNCWSPRTQQLCKSQVIRKPEPIVHKKQSPKIIVNLGPACMAKIANHYTLVSIFRVAGLCSGKRQVPNQVKSMLDHKIIT